VNDRPIAQILAQQYRTDLKDAGIGDGTYAFYYSPSSLINYNIQRIAVFVGDRALIYTGGLDPFAPVIPWPLPLRDECAFYHCIDLPGGESVEDAYWDLRGRFESYLGGYPVCGRTLLDVGTASGFLAFSAEELGAAQVTAVDAFDANEFHRIPFKNSPFTEDRSRWIADTGLHLHQLKNSFWYAWHKKKSSVEVVYTFLSHLWKWSRKFDVVVAGAIVEHVSDPIPFISSLTSLASEAVIIAFTPVAEAHGQYMNTMNDWDVPQFNYSWWTLSKDLYKRIFQNLGFSCEFTVASAICNVHTPPSEVVRPTIIARRQAG
jgi:2-polyprenyl-3-methyl-5-hydroxy-6-metoxy-1,4-benzoquinol methylase